MSRGCFWSEVCRVPIAGKSATFPLDLLNPQKSLRSTPFATLRIPNSPASPSGGRGVERCGRSCGLKSIRKAERLPCIQARVHVTSPITLQVSRLERTARPEPVVTMTLTAPVGLITTLPSAHDRAVKRLAEGRGAFEPTILAFSVPIISIVADVNRARTLRRVTKETGCQTLAANPRHPPGRGQCGVHVIARLEPLRSVAGTARRRQRLRATANTNDLMPFPKDICEPEGELRLTHTEAADNDVSTTRHQARA